MNLKAIVAKFQNETQSNSILDFVVWVDCQEELKKELDKQFAGLKRK